MTLYYFKTIQLIQEDTVDPNNIQSEYIKYIIQNICSIDAKYASLKYEGGVCYTVIVVVAWLCDTFHWYN